MKIPTSHPCTSNRCNRENRTTDAGASKEAKDFADNDGGLDDASVRLCEGIEGAIDLRNGLGCEEEETVRKARQ